MPDLDLVMTLFLLRDPDRAAPASRSELFRTMVIDPEARRGPAGQGGSSLAGASRLPRDAAKLELRRGGNEPGASSPGRRAANAGHWLNRAVDAPSRRGSRAGSWLQGLVAVRGEAPRRMLHRSCARRASVIGTSARCLRPQSRQSRSPGPMAAGLDFPYPGVDASERERRPRRRKLTPRQRRGETRQDLPASMQYANRRHLKQKHQVMPSDAVAVLHDPKSGFLRRPTRYG